MALGSPKETKDQESRDDLIRDDAPRPIAVRHAVCLVRSAGIGSGLSDNDYVQKLTITRAPRPRVLRVDRDGSALAERPLAVEIQRYAATLMETCSPSR
jgi:hypothetical protein